METVENNINILVVDDEDRIRRLLAMYLERENYNVTQADNGISALDLALNNDYDIILLDIMMPGKDGLEVLKELRQVKKTPVILLTAKAEEINVIDGFNTGADDYVAKPFSPREIVLRVKSLLRRVNENPQQTMGSENSDVVLYHELYIDNDAHRVTVANNTVSLTPKEYDLLIFLAKAPNKVFEREQLLKEVWQYDYFGDLRTVDTHIKRLREKLYKHSEEVSKMIVTVWGIGYKFESRD